MEYTRDKLIGICESAFVLEKKWKNRDSSDAQRQLGELYALLKAGCDFEIDTKESDEKSVWVKVYYEGFGYFESYDVDTKHKRDYKQTDTFYLPTQERLDDVNGDDWY